MERIFSKEHATEFLAPYGLMILAGPAFSILLCPERHALSAVLGIIIMYCWVYFAHRVLHVLPSEGPLSHWNTHWNFHHQPLKLLDRHVELAIELINDLCMSLTILAIQYFSPWRVPTSVVIFFAIWYSSVHIVNYSIIGSPHHREHHAQIHKNFGPDVMDHFFGTNHSNVREDLVGMTVNIIFAFALTFLLKETFHWNE